MSDDSNKSHHVVELNGGKALYSDKGKFYLNRRANPKAGIRKPTPGQEERFRAGMDKVFPIPPCEDCGAEMLIKNRRLCDECREKED